MYNIQGIEKSSITDPELLELMEEALHLGIPGEKFILILARVPSYAKAILKAMIIGFNQGNIDHRIKEVMRVQLARFAGDSYSGQLRSKRAIQEGLEEDLIDSGSNDYEDDERFSEAEKVALRFSDQMYLDPKKVDKYFYDEMKKHYSEAQIMELGGFMVLQYGMQTFIRTLDLSSD